MFSLYTLSSLLHPLLPSTSSPPLYIISSPPHPLLPSTPSPPLFTLSPLHPLLPSTPSPPLKRSLSYASSLYTLSSPIHNPFYTLSSPLHHPSTPLPLLHPHSPLPPHFTYLVPNVRQCPSREKCPHHLWVALRGSTMEGCLPPLQTLNWSTHYMLTHTHTSTQHTQAHTHKHTYIHTYIYTYIHTYIYTYIHAYIHTYIHTYMHTYIHIYIHTYIHTYILNAVWMLPHAWYTTCALIVIPIALGIIYSLPKRGVGDSWPVGCA